MRDKKTATEAVAKPSVSPSYAAQIYVKPEPKILASAGQKITSTNLSLKKMLNPDSEAGSVGGLSNVDLPKEPFTIDQVNMYWRRCANLLKEEGRETTYNAMVKRNPKLINDVRIVMEVDNPVQIDLVNTDVDRIIDFMRSNLKNYDVFVEAKLTDNQFEDIKTLTGKDRFAILARKYPNLNLLKSTFNLDVDY